MWVPRPGKFGGKKGRERIGLHRARRCPSECAGRRRVNCRTDRFAHGSKLEVDAQRTLRGNALRRLNLQRQASALISLFLLMLFDPQLSLHPH